MGWTTRGKVNVTLNSTVVTGVGSLFLQDGRIGDGFRGPDGRIYEVTNIATNTGLTIQPPYEGPTVNNATYYLAPFEGYVKDTADALRAASLEIGMLPASKQDKNANLAALSALTGAADRLPYFSGLGVLSLAVFTAKGRALLARTDNPGMQAELGLVPVTSVSDVTAGRLLTVGYQGLGGSVTLDSAYSWLGTRFKGWQANAPDGPPINSAAVGIDLGYAENRRFQLSIDANGTLYARANVTSAPTSAAGWNRVLTQESAILDPALNTGGMVYSASNASGSFIKFADGTLIVRGASSGVTGSELTNLYGAGGTSAATVTISFPIAFVNNSYSFSAQSGDRGMVELCFNKTVNGCSTQIRHSSISQTVNFTYMAIGRWKA